MKFDIVAPSVKNTLTDMIPNEHFTAMRDRAVREKKMYFAWNSLVYLVTGGAYHGTDIRYYEGKFYREIDSEE